ncbi:MAG: hypothetical protein OXN17_20450 [Candidatus Poribacteria bacterium]|nr:hypothetical protein [Candidatus Poribacteria bacterium]MDE0506275.1 hypothetical protein [Candidatus Poribacteria bacterium]
MTEKSKKIEPDNGLRQFLRHALAPVSSAAGSAVGLGLGAIAFPGAEAIGQVLGSSVGPVLTGLGQDIWERYLSPSEKQRLGTVLGVMVTEIHRRLENGESLRDDGFFDKKLGDRSDAEEVAESVLLKVRNEPEEKKIPYMGFLGASTAFDPEVGVLMAHQLTKAAEGLTYRQFCILKLCVDKEKYQLRDQHYRDPTISDRSLYPILHECHHLYHSGLIYHKGSLAFGGSQVFVPTDLTPRDMILNGLGVDLYHLMRLCLIPDAEIAPIAEQLK